MRVAEVLMVFARLRCTLRRLSLFFFFQAEDGIRDDLVTGVQTCALPIFYTLSLRAASSCRFGTGPPARCTVGPWVVCRSVPFSASHIVRDAAFCETVSTIVSG